MATKRPGVRSGAVRSWFSIHSTCSRSSRPDSAATAWRIVLGSAQRAGCSSRRPARARAARDGSSAARAARRPVDGVVAQRIAAAQAVAERRCRSAALAKHSLPASCGLLVGAVEGGRAVAGRDARGPLPARTRPRHGPPSARAPAGGGVRAARPRARARPGRRRRSARAARQPPRGELASLHVVVAERGADAARLPDRAGAGRRCRSAARTGRGCPSSRCCRRGRTRGRDGGRASPAAPRPRPGHGVPHSEEPPRPYPVSPDEHERRPRPARSRAWQGSGGRHAGGAAAAGRRRRRAGIARRTRRRAAAITASP